ncbi:general odorant-binding protein 99a-like [Drosophila sulfurigaster albostrigata]|uniref:general odorant-binding protein 99a-like n=1 Tax=Drosophila sulfurigaster albostrigata TaxID=89887 RepID=UPI002D21D3E8|nr:general odorant-binding protein 99a-like [Drosophila sulfurigaster albostrigata]
MFKYFVVCLALCSLAVSERERKSGSEINADVKKCFKEHPLTAEQTAQIKLMEIPDVPEVRPFLLCFSLALDIFSIPEGFNVDRMRDLILTDLSDDEKLQIIHKCVDRNEQKSPAGEWAFRVHKCLVTSKIGGRAKAKKAKA